MANEEKKAYLMGYIQAKRREVLIQKQIEELRSQKTSPSVLNDGMPHGSSVGDLSGYMASMDNLLNRLREEKENAVRQYEQVQSQIEKMGDETEKELLKRRYLLREGWEEIAVQMCYNYRYVLKIHGRALQHFELPKKGH